MVSKKHVCCWMRTLIALNFCLWQLQGCSWTLHVCSYIPKSCLSVSSSCCNRSTGCTAEGPVLLLPLLLLLLSSRNTCSSLLKRYRPNVTLYDKF
jgi:hypothetical protein